MARPKIAGPNVAGVAAKVKNRTGKKARADPGSQLWLHGLLCGAFATLATPTALLASVLLLPALIASMLDSQPGKPIARSIALSGLCGTVGPVIRLWAIGHTIDAATSLATDSNNLMIAWGAAAAGWLLAEIAPVAVRAILEAMALTRGVRLRAERAKYEAAWGFSPASEGD